nr:retrotransposon protein, putative, Ty1-copia subclass [Tanacetum cinerariifolium]
MKVNKVWIVVDHPPNAKVVRNKWLYKKKTGMDGKVHTYKACLVAKGCNQTFGIDYQETFSSIADIRAIRILIAISAYYDYDIWQMDVKTAFLNGRLDEDIYMEQPEGYVDLKYPNCVYKLQRAIHGLKQASRRWNKRLDEEIKRNKRAKLDLDSALLWHYRLRHISKKRIEKLQHDGLLNSSDLRAFEKCISCMFGKITRKPYTHQGKYMSQEFLDHLKDYRIIAHRTPPYTPQHIGVSKRRNKTLLDMVRSMMSQTTLPKSFWDYALETAARILNMVPTKKVEKTPYEVWHGKALKLSYLKVWGYPKETMGYSLYCPPENKVIVARNVKFLENSLIDQEASGSLEDLEIIQVEDTHPSLDTSQNHEKVADIRAIRILIAIAAYYDYEIWQMDVKTAFLNGYLNEEVYMEQPEGFVNPKYPNRSVKTYLGKCFAMKDLGEATYILRIKIYRDRSKRLIGLCQSAYIGKILKRYSMENSKRGSIPIQEKLKLSKSQGDQKRELRVSCYTDTGYLTNANDLKSQTGYVFVLNGGVVDRKSAKQSIFATSSAEAEYITAFDASKEAVWVRKLIFGLRVVPTIEEPKSMYCDNTGAIAIATESGITKGARHFRA